MKLHRLALCAFNRAISRVGPGNDSRLLWIVCGPQQAQKTVRAARAVRRLGSSDDSASGRGRRVRLRIVDLLTEMLKGISEERGAVA